ncbi:MAG: hypothetical protein EP324_03340 [Gammaproteobacteria bacterium]|nr:MAG: hypothetical protein EP324_03340 [Gammaproteobacteria bacterium]
MTLSTKADASVPLGDVTEDQVETVADWADKYGLSIVRIRHEQNWCCWA